MSRENWCESPDPRLGTYLKVIDSLARCLRLRVKASPPRTWAQFWRIVAEEQVIQRHHVMKLQPPTLGANGRTGDWYTPEMRAVHEEQRAEMAAIRIKEARRARAARRETGSLEQSPESLLGS